MPHYRAAIQSIRCKHRHRTPERAARCKAIGHAPDVVECIGGGPGGELERLAAKAPIVGNVIRFRTELGRKKGE